MKNLKLSIGAAALTCLTFFPAIANADIEQLDVTMEVLDSVGDLDGEVLEMRGPSPDEEEFFDDGEIGRDGEDDVNDLRADEEDGFSADDEFQSEADEEHSELESDFDEGDEIDTDEFDEIEMEDGEMPEEELAQ